MTKPKVPYVNFPAQFEENRAETMSAVEAVLEKGDFVMGQAVRDFEEEFAAISKSKFAISVANGTDALILAFKALGIKAGDEVITCPNSYLSTANAIVLVGAKPVFVDVRPDQNMDPEKLEAAITDKTKAIVPVHLTGRMAKMGEILSIANQKNIPVVEDAAQAVAATIDGHTSGSAGAIGCFSLHPLKNLNACGDAGIMTTSDEDIKKRLHILRNHGMKNRDEMELIGINSRLDTMQAAILNIRTKSLSSIIDRRRKNAMKYIEGLRGVVDLPIENEGEWHTYHVFCIQCDKRDKLKNHLESSGVECKIHYPIPIHLQKPYLEMGFKKGDFPVTESQADRILSLPIHPWLEESQVQYTIDTIRKFYGA